VAFFIFILYNTISLFKPLKDIKEFLSKNEQEHPFKLRSN